MKRNRLRLPIVLMAVVLLAGVLPGLTPLPAPPRATAQADAPHTDTIKAAFDLLMDNFYRVPDPAALLDAAWEGATNALDDAGVGSGLPAKPTFPSNRQAAWSAFASAYPSLAALIPAGADLDQTDLAFSAIDNMATSLNEGHTAFLDPTTYHAFIDQLTGGAERVGLGVVISGSRPPWLITEVAPDSPAERAGVKPGDAITAVDGRDVTGITRPNLSRALAGERGTRVGLTLSRPGEGDIQVTITRGPFVFPDFQSSIRPDGVGYMRLRSFSSFIIDPSGKKNVLQEMDAALERFEAAGVTSWVLDLRGNGGGSGFTVNDMLGHFLPDAITEQLSTERGNRAQNMAIGRPLRVQRPMAVLINGGSASASEIFASAMQEYGRAVVVGTTSEGVLAGAIPFPLPDGAALYVAVEAVRTGKNNVVVDEVGVTPDVEIPDTRTAADYAAGRDPQLAAAIGALKGRSVLPAPTIPYSGQLSQDALRALTAPYFPPASDVPTTPLIKSENVLGDLALNYPPQFGGFLGLSHDPQSLAIAVQARGWQGSYSRFYGEVPGLTGPSIGITIDLYSSQRGAYEALNTNDAPEVYTSAPVPVQIGDGTVAYNGVWELAGNVVLMWRSGRAVVTVTYSAVPGQESFDPVVELARRVDARLNSTPIPEPMPVP